MIPKYKAWDKKHDEMIRVISINFDEKFVRGLTAVESNLDIESSYNFEDIELLQSTGLKDKNGVEIFEGDVVKTKYAEHGRHIGVVKYSGAKFYSDGIKQYLSWHEGLNGLFEIIGNKFEHPHLLEFSTEAR